MNELVIFVSLHWEAYRTFLTMLDVFSKRTNAAQSALSAVENFLVRRIVPKLANVTVVLSHGLSTARTLLCRWLNQVTLHAEHFLRGISVNEYFEVNLSRRRLFVGVGQRTCQSCVR
jgi:hypothetical protein